MFPIDVFPDNAKVNRQGHLVIGGCDVVGLAEQFGTPLYILDEVTLRDRCRQFTSEFHSLYNETTVAYASKAYINRALARIFMEEGLSLDVVSGGELAVAKSAQFPLDKVYFHGNNKSQEELQDALECGIGRIVVDSFYDLDLLDNLACQAGKRQDVLIRVSPGVDPHTHVYTTTGILDSKFGFPMETGQAEEAVRLALKAQGLNLVGLHFHLGSPIFETEPYRVAIELVLEFALKMRKEGFCLEEISPGGGFAIAYTKDDEPPPIAKYAQVIVSSMVDKCHTLDMDLPRLIIEPGRAIIGPAGVAIYRVGAKKHIPGVRDYVFVDGGMGDNIRPVLYDAQYEAVAADLMREETQEKVTIAGKYCESGDILVRDLVLPRVSSGNLIAIPAVGAYCPSMASTYNLNPRPAMVLVCDGNGKLIRRRETYEDLQSCDLD